MSSADAESGMKLIVVTRVYLRSMSRTPAGMMSDDCCSESEERRLLEISGREAYKASVRPDRIYDCGSVIVSNSWLLDKRDGRRSSPNSSLALSSLIARLVVQSTRDVEESLSGSEVTGGRKRQARRIPANVLFVPSFFLGAEVVTTDDQITEFEGGYSNVCEDGGGLMRIDAD